MVCEVVHNKVQSTAQLCFPMRSQEHFSRTACGTNGSIVCTVPSGFVHGKACGISSTLSVFYIHARHPRASVLNPVCLSCYRSTRVRLWHFSFRSNLRRSRLDLLYCSRRTRQLQRTNRMTGFWQADAQTYECVL